MIRISNRSRTCTHGYAGVCGWVYESARHLKIISEKFPSPKRAYSPLIYMIISHPGLPSGPVPPQKPENIFQLFVCFRGTFSNISCLRMYEWGKPTSRRWSSPPYGYLDKRGYGSTHLPTFDSMGNIPPPPLKGGWGNQEAPSRGRKTQRRTSSNRYRYYPER
jgi:hypothetical protein